MIMKKYFIFAAVAAAGLFASCSSSDDIASNDVGAIENPDARQAIRLNLATPGSMASRGTGTVGGVGTISTDPNYIANVWAGQTINVFMFTKGTASTADVYFTQTEIDDATAAYGTDNVATMDAADQATWMAAHPAYGKTTSDVKTPASAGDAYATVLKLTETDASTPAAPVYFYDNLAMYTPGSAANKIPSMNASVASGEAMITDGTINYYPPQGNFDFFGYHGDDAVATTPTITKTDALWTVPFTIDGTQDLMSTKAELTTDQNTTMTGAPTEHQKDYYSAYAARKGVHPTLTFKHLLTRLQFSVKAGNDAAAGNEGGSAAVLYTDATAYAHNSSIAGAIKIGDQKTPAVYFTQTEIDDATAAYSTDNVATMSTDDQAAWMASHPAYGKTTSDVKTPATTYETEAECNDANVAASLAGAVKAGDEASPAVPAGQNIANAVKVTSIQVLSENTEGDLAVAWTGAKADYEKITWAATQPDEAARWLTLKERPISYKFDGTPTFTYADLAAYADKDNAWYTALDDNSTPTKATVDGAVAALVDGRSISTNNRSVDGTRPKYKLRWYGVQS